MLLCIPTICSNLFAQVADTVNWAQHYEQLHQKRIAENRSYYNHVLAINQKLLRGEEVSFDEAIAAIPRTADEILVLWGNNDEEGENRGYRVDSISFSYVKANPRLDLLGRYFTAAYYSDGYVAENYHYACYILWKQYPQEVKAVLSILFGPNEDFTKEFMEYSIWDSERPKQ